MTTAKGTPTAAPPFTMPTKPPLVCHLLSPLYGGNISDQFYLLSQTVPRHGLCDFVVLDLPLWPNGTYPPDSYDFLPNGTGYKFLFTINVIDGHLVLTQIVLNTPNFKNSVRRIRKLQGLPLYGFGILNDLRIPTSAALAKESADPLRALTNALRTEGVSSSEVRNFIAFRPSSYTLRRDIYQALLNVINSIRTIRLVFLLTLTLESTKYALPSSAWDQSCQPLTNEVKMMDVVDLIASVWAPKVNFTLTVSLRFDTFTHLRIADLGHGDVDLMLSYDHASGYYERMVAAYRHLGYSRTREYIIGWSVFNVSQGLAPQQCNGTDNRINQIREVLDDNW
ncbi:hypothetical protein HPB52_004581 [Rhipicephalus sanguineus]|uniref:Uncharacterized protein n=1 Tax=Rhipicephalus sanguineus TaxID=34632 RepID=A0A9D4QDK8_RHISA|nr:hypothetical protein HPB52_004581 [Rhipicephalus sanguineus]